MKYTVKVLALNAGKNIYRSGDEVDSSIFGAEKLAKLVKGGYLMPVESEAAPVKNSSIKNISTKTKAQITAEQKAAEKAEKERLKAEAEAAKLEAEAQAEAEQKAAAEESARLAALTATGQINLNDNDL